MSCEGNVGVGGGIGSGNPTVYPTAVAEFNDFFLHFGGTPETCSWPIISSGGGLSVAPGTHEYSVDFHGYGNDVPVGAVIEGANIIFDGGIANNPSTVNLTLYVRIGGTRYDLYSGSTNDPSYLQWNAGLLAVNPSNNLPWTKADILAASWGIEVDNYFFLNTVYVEVYWSVSSGEGGLTITSVTPNSGPPAGGMTVVIVGTGFSTVYSVMFGTVAATSFTIDSSTQITAVTPAHALGYADVILAAS
jgi:hypothetical protein